MTVANAVERLEAAIDKLETLKQESFDGPWVANHPFSYSWITGARYAGMQSKIADRVRKPDAELIVTLHRTIDAQLAILRDNLERYSRNPDKEPVAPTGKNAVALADAILSGGPLLPSERARVAVFGLDKPEDTDAPTG